ncbi:MAG: hypothetical protein CFE29_17925 [Bradyrhizobiaceae bacterium PARB1]|nr:MAG: hypothetical protein CFE29_17925 [Bradyrhizobiaceae bacterium PARB1]
MILERFFTSKTTAITAEMIRADITRCEGEISAHHDQMAGVMANIATMTDSDHVTAEAKIAATKRAIARLDARVGHLAAELPKVVAAEQASAKIAADELLRQRAEAARKANTKEAAKLLSEYEKLAGPMADIFARLAEIRTETDVVNAQLSKNKVAETVSSFETIHRKTPDRLASERRETRLCYVYRYPASPRDTETVKYVQIPASEEVREATIGRDGNPLPVGAVHYDQFGRNIIIHPKLEDREIVVERKPAKRGLYEESLDEIRLPPAFAGGEQHWPRK